MDNQQPSRIGCSVGAISNCCKGRTKTSQGYVWKYAEGSTTKYLRKPSESVRSSSIKEDEDIVSTSSESQSSINGSFG